MGGHVHCKKKEKRKEPTVVKCDVESKVNLSRDKKTHTHTLSAGRESERVIFVTRRRGGGGERTGKSRIDGRAKHAFKSPLSKSVNQYQLGC